MILYRHEWAKAALPYNGGTATFNSTELRAWQGGTCVATYRVTNGYRIAFSAQSDDAIALGALNRGISKAEIYFWQPPAPPRSIVVSAPLKELIAHNGVFVACYSKQIEAFDKNGARVWHYADVSPLSAVYALTSGQLVAAYRDNGALLVLSDSGRFVERVKGVKRPSFTVWGDMVIARTPQPKVVYGNAPARLVRRLRKFSGDARLHAQHSSILLIEQEGVCDVLARSGEWLTSFVMPTPQVDVFTAEHKAVLSSFDPECAQHATYLWECGHGLRKLDIGMRIADARALPDGRMALCGADLYIVTPENVTRAAADLNAQSISAVVRRGTQTYIYGTTHEGAWVVSVNEPQSSDCPHGTLIC